MQIQSLGQEQPLEEESATHSSNFAICPWEKFVHGRNPMDRRNLAGYSPESATTEHTHTATHKGTQDPMTAIKMNTKFLNT